MQDFIQQVARILYPQMSDQQLMRAIQQVKQESAGQPDDMIVLAMIDEFVNGEE